MKIETQPRDDHQIKLIVELEQEQLERKMRKAARVIAERNRIPGFRPGKAPYDMVLRYAGEARVQQDAVEMLVEEVYPEMLKQENIEPGAVGTLEDVLSTTPPKFSFIIPLKPVVQLADYRQVRQPYEYKGVSDAEVVESLDRFRNSYATYEAVDRAAKEDDILGMTYSAVNLSASPEEEIFKDRPLQVRVLKKDESREAEHPFEGFSRKFLGAKAGTEQDLEYTYPEDHIRQDVKGKKVRYHVKVDAVKEIVLPEVNLEWVKNFGEFNSVDDFKAEIRHQLEANNQAEYDATFYKSIIDQIKAGATIKYPPQLLDQEKEQVLNNIQHELSHQHMDLEAYLKIRKQNVEEFIEKEVTPAAVERLERSLIMDEISRSEKLELSKEELQSSYIETLNEMAGTPEFQKLQNSKKPQTDLQNAIAMEAASRAINRRVFQVLKSIATGESAEGKPEKPAPSEKAARSAAPKKAAANKPSAKKPAAKPAAASKPKKTADKTEG